MFQIKQWIYYLDIYAENDYKWDRKINIFNAIVSSTSIAAWTIWSELSFVWGAAIACSQILAAVKSFLPFNKRLKAITSFIIELKTIFVDIEHKWYLVANGEMTESEINDAIRDYKMKYELISSKYMIQEIVIREDFRDMADKMAIIYFENNYGEEADE